MSTAVMAGQVLVRKSRLVRVGLGWAGMAWRVRLRSVEVWHGRRVPASNVEASPVKAWLGRAGSA